MTDFARSLEQADVGIATADNATIGDGGVETTGPAVAEPKPPRPNRRAHPRYLARWRAALIGERVRHLGRTENVSISGVAVVCDANLRPGQELNVYLEIPQKNSNQPAVFEALAVVMHCTLTPQGFRLGLSFRFFRGDSQSILRKALSSGNYRELVDPHFS
ncbi:MAG: PilZ domain-containing protein [Thiobacillaceae bacterium]